MKTTRLYQITDHDGESEEYPLQDLLELTDFSDEEVDALVDLDPGGRYEFEEFVIKRIQ